MPRYITQHVKEQFLRRFSKKEVYKHLQDCRIDSCKQCKLLVKQLRREANTKEVHEEVKSILDKAKENKSYLNNSNFMDMIYEKYGYDKRYRFLLNGNVVFVIVVRNNQEFVVTCLIGKYSIFNNFLHRKKYVKN